MKCFLKVVLKVVISVLIVVGAIGCICLTGFSIGKCVDVGYDVAVTDKSIPESSDVKYGDYVDLIRARNDLQVGDVVMSVSKHCVTDIAVVKEVNEYEAFTEVTLLGSEEYPEDQTVNLKETCLYRLTRYGDWSVLGHWYMFLLTIAVVVGLVVLGVWWFDEGIYEM